jgi:hypothetical protein
LVFKVTPIPVVGFTDPVDEIRMSPDALVDCGVVTAVEMTVSAFAGTAAITVAIAPRPVVASRDRIRKLPFFFCSGGTGRCMFDGCAPAIRETALPGMDWFK